LNTVFGDTARQNIKFLYDCVLVKCRLWGFRNSDLDSHLENIETFGNWTESES